MKVPIGEGADAVEIDGSIGEGGGQVLRSALALSLVTGRELRIRNIRSRRKKPGLQPQHLKAVEAAATVGMARTEGAHLGSQSLVFQPHGIRSGEFEFDIGTAGSTSLVLQTILLPLSFASEPSSVTVRGGTHVPWSPCFHYLDLHWIRYMRKIGFDLKIDMELAGFYPQGAGVVNALVQRVVRVLPLRLTERGALKRIHGISAVSNLDFSIAERQRDQALRRLADQFPSVEIDIVQMPSRFRGTMLLLVAEFEHSQCCYFGLGARGKPAERVADEAVDQLFGFLDTDGAIDERLADQLILPLAFASGTSKLRTSKVTQHLLTNAEVLRTCLSLDIQITGDLGKPGLVRINGRSFPSVISDQTKCTILL
jgi:RNA 3'-terminal phosphate cyclase (ATP)